MITTESTEDTEFDDQHGEHGGHGVMITTGVLRIVARGTPGTFT